MSLFLKYLLVFGMSMVPVIELRGAIPAGLAQGLNPALVYLLSVAGNMLPVPFIIFFIRPLFAWMKRKSAFLHNIATKLENKAANKIDKVRKYELLGLLLFVAIPAPGTGAWTGALIAALFDMRIKHSVISIFGGVLVAGILMLLISGGVSLLIPG